MKHILKFLPLVALVVLCFAGKQKAHKLYMVGDSTMADKKELQASPERGWGQLFPTFIDSTKFVIENHAVNGRSTKSFLSEGRWQDVVNKLEAGDVVIIQFGHNDAKQKDSTRYSTPQQYKENLRLMVSDVRAKGATPILCTPINRRQFKKGQFNPSHGDYPQQVRNLALEEKVALIDMEALSAHLLQAMGEEKSKPYFMNVEAGKWSKFPNGKTDNTHFQESGALMMGQLAAGAIEKNQIDPLCKTLVKAKKQKPAYTHPVKLRSGKVIPVEQRM